MDSICANIQTIRGQLPPHVQLICVSKFHPIDAIRLAYNEGERDFAESRVQELVTKHLQLPQDIRWHMIGHLQTNKVRAILPFVHLIQSVDSEHLLTVINQEAERIQRVVKVLLEVHVAKEDTKSGFTESELRQLLREQPAQKYPFVQIVGIMGMSTQTEDSQEIRRCFQQLYTLSQLLATDHPTTIRSYGMSSDYRIAIEEGANMIRIGTDIFGERQ